MDVADLAREILNSGYVCDHCLGRQFAQLLSGFSNRERGEAVRVAVAMAWDSKPFPVDAANFHGMKFRKRETPAKKPGKCSVCGGLFAKLGNFVPEVKRKLKGIEFGTFLVGTKLSAALAEREECLWERVGIEWCEPLKAEVNREFGKMLEKELGKTVDLESPDVEIILNLAKGGVEIRIASLYAYGRYKKLVRGIPQTKWDMYPVTVEDIIAKPFMAAAKGTGHSLHGSGREDIDARCLDWRPFVLEIKGPKRRRLDLKALERRVNRSRKVEVSGLRFSSRDGVRKVKSEKRDKTYRLIAVFGKPVGNLSRLKELEGLINQQTPARVMHRRSDLLRKRHVRAIRWRKLSAKTVEFTVRGESGLYVKELITGDGGRTRPSAAEILGSPARVKNLDVMKIWK
jgi:tRNA pseudouridine synthase 10